MSVKPAILGERRPGIAPALSPIAETMLITLWARAAESRRRDAIVRDEQAARIAAALAYDFDRFRGGWKSQVGVAVRTRFLDELTRRFLRHHPDAFVVSLGAGLDTRFERVDNGTVRWIDLDQPDAIALRRRFLPETERNRSVAGCMLDQQWLGLIPRGAPLLVLAEGVLMFCDQPQVRALVDALARRFPGGEMAFDCIGGLMVRFPWLHDTLPATEARFRWGLGSARELARWSPRAEVVSVAPMLAESSQRWRWMRWLRHSRYMRGQFVVAHLRFATR